MKIVRILSLTVLLLLAGCTYPRVTDHPQPELKVDHSPFENGDCPLDENGYDLGCTPGTPLYKAGCDRIDQVSDLLGGLEPSHPIAMCIFEPRRHPEISNAWNIPETEYFFNIGGPLPTLVRYVIQVDGKFQLIKNEDEFRAVFAPVNSAEEALSTALTVHDLHAEYDLKLSPFYRYEVKAIEDTHVEEVQGGWLVHLFDYMFYGCGPHYYFAVDIKVSTDGRTEEVSRTKIYSDPLMDGLCQD
jgi:hypothetical protein